MAESIRTEQERAKHTLDAIVERVCGACEMNCCLQGTMVGSDDARRIAKAARLSREFRDGLLAGLRSRGGELRRDLEGLENVARLLRARFAGEMDSDLQRLEVALDDWRGFCEFLETEFAPELDHLLRCLLFSGIRATVLRAMGAFPGGANVLPSLTGAGTSFHIGRRGIKPDRCLFHVGACIVPGAKPHKCADFYCASDPGLVHEVVDGVSFDDFALAHFVPLTAAELVERLRTERDMGAEFFECKVVVGADPGTVEEVLGVLREALGEVEERVFSGGHLDVAVDVPELTSSRAARPLAIRCGSVDALAVYELAVALVRARGESVRPAVVVLADEWRRRAGAEHALWQERAMSQPLSALELLAVVDGQERDG